MKKLGRAAVGIMLFCAWGFAAFQVVAPDSLARIEGGDMPSRNYIIADADVPLAGPVSPEGKQENGWLSVSQGQLCNESGEAFQLRGMSSHGIAWFPQYLSYSSINTTKTYGANVFRIAMYADYDAGNYTLEPADQEKNKASLYAAVTNTLSADMYAIVDWHTMKVGNPMEMVEPAVAFFDEVSQKYANEPGVIYEICNEPNGGVTWADITEYANRVIPAIRKNSPNALIIVGTPDYSSDLKPSIAEPLPYDNVMYTYHYYSAITYRGYKKMLDAARDAQHPVFVTEWGLGGDEKRPKNLQEGFAKAFVDYLNEHGISWTNWSLCNKEEAFSAIRSDVEKLSDWTVDDLTVSGKLVFQALGGSL